LFSFALLCYDYFVPALFFGPLLDQYSQFRFGEFELPLHDYDLSGDPHLLLLREDRSAHEVESPVEVRVEHPQGLLTVGDDGGDIERSGLSVSGFDLFIDEHLDVGFGVEPVLTVCVLIDLGLIVGDLRSGHLDFFLSL